MELLLLLLSSLLLLLPSLLSLPSHLCVPSIREVLRHLVAVHHAPHEVEELLLLEATLVLLLLLVMLTSISISVGYGDMYRRRRRGETHLVLTSRCPGLEGSLLPAS